ncbi:MAG: hypothetical protein IT290_09200 [Deltaproteobacteria bacterium]|nr:hypothetical protein [Deltaproteobacteria bacterium]
MSHGAFPVTLKDVPAIVTAHPPRLSGLSKAFLLILMGVGAVGLILGLLKDPTRTWTVVHVNFIYWLILSAASTGFAAVFQICNAQWVRPLRRIFESPSDFLFVLFVPFLLIYLFGHEHVFSHHHGIEGGKGMWLGKNFMFIRDAVVLILFIVVARKVIFLSMRQDIGAIRSGLTGVSKDALLRWQGAQYDKYVAGWSSDAKGELRQAQNRRGFLAPVVVIFYAVAFSFIAFDLVMSVDPHWISTLFGAFIFMSGVYVAVAWNSMGIGFARELHPLFRAKIQRTTLHDLGKLLFGFGIFWMYLAWSHYLTIWYGNLPEETGWLILRTRLEPWHTMAWSIVCCCFIYPFLFGLNRDGKQVPRLLFITGTVVAIGIWLLCFFLIVPTLSPNTIPLGFLEATISAGFMGGFLFSAARYLERVPLIPFGDLYLKQSKH